MAKSLVSLAKGNSKKAVAQPPKPVVKKVTTPEEDRDIKAKATIGKLLQDIPLNGNPVKNEELMELEPETKSSSNNTEWLQEQVALLASENENLKIALSTSKDDYSKILTEIQRLKGNVTTTVDDGQLATKITTVFHELQSNYIQNPGFTQFGTPNFVIVPAAFLNRLIMYFPFLQNEKRF